jgi:hypothetical protein
MPKTYSTHVVIPGVHEASLEVDGTEVKAVFTYKGEVYNTLSMSNRTLESAKEYMDNWAEFAKGLLPNKFGWSK